jgi:nucleotide-binding universal stress UspA family protein
MEVDMPSIMRSAITSHIGDAPRSRPYFTARDARRFTADAATDVIEAVSMLSTVLIGFDGSDRGRDALALGRALAATDGEIVIVCVYPSVLLLVDSVELASETDDEARFDAARTALDGDPRAIYVSRRDASVAAGLHAEAKRRHADVLVVGSSHRGPIGRILLGSVTRQTLLAAPCAVAVAPVGLHSDRPLHARVRIIDIADAAQDGADWPGVWLVPELAETVAAEAQQAVDEAIAGVPDDVRVAGHSIRGTVVPELLTATKQLDLLILGSRNYGPVRRVLLGSVSGKVVEAADCPVLVVPRSLDDGRADAVPGQAVEVGIPRVQRGALALSPSPGWVTTVAGGEV